MTAAEWREWFDNNNLYIGPGMFERMVLTMENLEHQVAAYREDRLALIARIDELTQLVNEGGN